MYQRKRLQVVIAAALISLFVFSPLNVLANDDNSGLPSLKALVNQLSDKLNNILGQVESTNNSVAFLQKQVSKQQEQIDQLQNQIEELKNQTPPDGALTPSVTISIASFSGEDYYSGQTFPMEHLKNKEILVTDAMNVSKTYTIKTDNEGKASITLPAGLYLFDFNPNAEYHGSKIFLVTDKVSNPKIALVSIYTDFQIFSNIGSGTEIFPSSKYDDGNYLSRF